LFFKIRSRHVLRVGIDLEQIRIGFPDTLSEDSSGLSLVQELVVPLSGLSFLIQKAQGLQYIDVEAVGNAAEPETFQKLLSESRGGA
jgi:hypothetical protein